MPANNPSASIPVIRIVLLLVHLFSFVHLSGQDIHFSQFTASPLMVNPALSGFFNDQLRVGLNYRNQGATISIPYQTYAATIDGVVQPAFLHDNWIGIGGILYNDNAGAGSLRKTSVLITSAFHKGFNRFSTLIGSVGFAVGLVNRSVDYSKLVFGSQWDGIQFDPNLSNNENYSTSSFLYLDLNVGIMLSWKFYNSSNISAGVSLNHVNKPGESFYSGSGQLGWKWIAHANANLRIDDQWILEPGVIYFYMNGLSELMMGANFHYGKGDLRVCSGLWYRVNRELIPMIGLDYRRYSLLFSYDFTVSDLKKASNSQGGFEISVRRTFSIATKKARCDNFRFF
jgi:type IX secretion system PorP/SprF family membrane protein